MSHGLSTTLWPGSIPFASGPRLTTSATTSWPGTWGSEEKADIGLSMSPSLKSPMTSLASDPHTPGEDRPGDDPVRTDRSGVRHLVHARTAARAAPAPTRRQAPAASRPDRAVRRRRAPSSSPRTRSDACRPSALSPLAITPSVSSASAHVIQITPFSDSRASSSTQSPTRSHQTSRLCLPELGGAGRDGLGSPTNRGKGAC